MFFVGSNLRRVACCTNGHSNGYLLRALVCAQLVLYVSALDISPFLGRGMSFLLNQKYLDGKELPAAFKEYALGDRSNEEIGRATAQEIIVRSGYNYENHYVVSDDGYITQMVRIINPLADRRMLKQPPVLFQQGGITDMTIWIMASAIQHHPEKYPREPGDGIMTSWNRSMAFTLANNGYDVWLAPTRGRNDQNLGHIKMKNKLKLPNLTLNSNVTEDEWLELEALSAKHRSLGDIVKYWDYSMDDIAAYEVPNQIDKVLEVTGAHKLTLFPMSFSTMHTMLAMAAKPRYMKKIYNSVVWGPIANNKGTNLMMSTLHNSACKYIPTEVGTIIFTELIANQMVRDISLFIGQIKEIRYSLIMVLLMMLAGPSAPFQTLLEPAVYGHVPMPTGFKEVKHYAQMAAAAKFQRYDYGMFRNKKIYGQMFPPAYNTDDIEFGSNWMLISSEFDMLATIESVKQYMGTIKRKPFEHIFVKGYNHLDLWAGIDNDIKINLPVLGFLDNFHLPPLRRDSMSQPVDDDLRGNFIGGGGGGSESSSRSLQVRPLSNGETHPVVQLPAEKPQLKKVITAREKRTLIAVHGLPPSARALVSPPLSSDQTGNFSISQQRQLQIATTATSPVVAVSS